MKCFFPACHYKPKKSEEPQVHNTMDNLRKVNIRTYRTLWDVASVNMFALACVTEKLANIFFSITELYRCIAQCFNKLPLSCQLVDI